MQSVVISILLTVAYGVASNNMTDPMLETSEIDGSGLEKRSCKAHRHPCLMGAHQCCHDSPACYQSPDKPTGQGICGKRHCAPIGAVPKGVRCCSGQSLTIFASLFHTVCTDSLCKCIPINGFCSKVWSPIKDCCNKNCVHLRGRTFGFCRQLPCLPQGNPCHDRWHRKCCGKCYFEVNSDLGHCVDVTCVPYAKEIPTTVPRCCRRLKPYPTKKEGSSICNHIHCVPDGALCEQASITSPTKCCSGLCVNNACSPRRCVPVGSWCLVNGHFWWALCCNGDCINNICSPRKCIPTGQVCNPKFAESKKCCDEKSQCKLLYHEEPYAFCEKV